MNDVGQLFESIVRGVPVLEVWWERYGASDEFMPEHPYPAIGELAHLVVEAHRAGGNDGIGQFFRNVESALQAASHSNRKLLVVGLLEGLQNAALNAGIGFDGLSGDFGQVTRQYWLALNELWAGRVSPVSFNRLIDR